MAFEAFLTQDKAKPKKGRRITYTISLALHGALLIVGVVYSFWHVEELSPPSVQVTFMSAMAPPPPPPPPPKKRASTKPKTQVKPVEVIQPKPTEIVQPRETPKEQPKPEPEDDSGGDEGEEDGEENGVVGGVKGGVVGGVIGGQVGGVVGSAGPAGDVAPKTLPPNIASGQLAIDPQSDQYRPRLPPALNRAGTKLWAMSKVCVSKDGSVVDVKIIKGADPLVDPEIVAKVRTWKYRPYMINGNPTPFCFMLRLDMSSTL